MLKLKAPASTAAPIAPAAEMPEEEGGCTDQPTTVIDGVHHVPRNFPKRITAVPRLREVGAQMCQEWHRRVCMYVVDISSRAPPDVLNGRAAVAAERPRDFGNAQKETICKAT